jgi:hypothetical protein
LDIDLTNTGEAEETLDCNIRVTCVGGSVLAAEALPGWEMSESFGVVNFKRTNEPLNLLSPGNKRAIGWIRLNVKSSIYAEIAR